MANARLERADQRRANTPPKVRLNGKTVNLEGRSFDPLSFARAITTNRKPKRRTLAEREVWQAAVERKIGR